MKTLGIGLIGFGFMGRTHTYGYKNLPLFYENLPFRIKLKGICSTTAGKAESVRDEYGFEFGTVKSEELFACKDIDIIDICTPNNTHKDLVIKALKAGKHVYCEKPLAVSSSEAGEILEAWEGTGLTAQMVFNYRFFPATLRAKQLIEEGCIGRPLSFRIEYLHSGSVDPCKPVGWKQISSIGGGGVLFDIGSHALDLAYYYLGEFQSVISASQVAYPKRPDKNGSMVAIDAEDQAVLLVRMRNGALGTVEASKIATGTNDELRFEIHGDKGALRFNLMKPNWLDFYDNTVTDQPLGGQKGFTRIECVQRYEKPGGIFPASKASIGWLRGHVHCLYSFLNSVYEGNQAVPSLADGAYIQYVMEKAYESEKQGKWMEL